MQLPGRCRWWTVLVALLLLAVPATAQDVEEQPVPRPGQLTDENMTDVRNPGADEQPEEHEERVDQPSEVGESFDQPPEEVPVFSILLVAVLAAALVLVIVHRGRKRENR